MKRVLSFILAMAIIFSCVPTMIISSAEGTLSGEKASYGKLVDDLMENMTLEEKVYQLFCVTLQSLAGAKGDYYELNDAFKTGISNCPVGGVILFDSNIRSADQVKKLNSDLAGLSLKVPLMITVDEEGGTVSRLKGVIDSSLVLDNMYTYKSQGVTKAKANAAQIAGYLTDFGFNADFAPVADVWSNSANTVIGKRAYSDDFAEAAVLVGAAVGGFADGNIICTLKHFPGHGDTTKDSHAGVVHVTKTVSEIKRDEFQSFSAGISAGADMVMIGHLNIDDLDPDTPALFSKTVVTDWLRTELGFDGVIVTDALEMGALGGYTDAQIAVKALEAGVDMLLMPGNLKNAANAIISAAGSKSSTIDEERIDASVRRILMMKAEHGLLGEPAPDPGDTEGFTVQYYANIQRLDTTGAAENELPVIDTSGGKLPLNGHYTDTNNNVIENGGSVNFRNIFLKSVGTNKYKVATHNELTKVYKTREFVYDDAPGLEYVDILQGNANYGLKEVWVLKAGKSADSVDPADWTVYTDTDSIRFTNTQSSAGGNVIFIDDSTVIRLVYDPSSARLNNAVDMWDIDGTDGKWYKNHNKTGGTYATAADADGKVVYMNTYLSGINVAENYDGGASDTRPKYAFGNANTFAGRQDEVWININDFTENTPNKYNRTNTNLFGLTLGLVSGLDENGNLIWTTVYDEGEIVPELSINGLDIFSDTELVGKTAVEGSSLQFLRDGDTYTLFGVTGTQASVTDLDRFFNPTSVASFRPGGSGTPVKYHWVTYDGGTYDGATVSRIFTNNFWPLDTVSWYGTVGHDAKYGDATWALNSYLKGQGYTSSISTGTLENGRRFFGDTTLTFPNSSNTTGSHRAMPVADDGVNHNTLFAMRYEVKFNLDESYCGPLEYLFFGDDDMWVFLDGKLICDIGGVHSSVGEYVNLWDYLTPTRGDNDSVYGEHTLSFFYTERGHSGSSCYMMFTLPEVTTKIPAPEHTDLVIKKYVTGTADKDTEKEFNVNVALTLDNAALLDDCFYTRYNSEGNSVETGTIHQGSAILKIRADETIIISNLLVGTQYTVTENDYSSDGYVTTVTGGSGEITSTALSTVEITNKRDSYGDLTVSKVIAGNDADPDKEFGFRVVLGDTTISGTFGGITFTNGIATFTLKGGQSKTADDLPNGVTYTVTETDYASDGYVTIMTGETGKISEYSVAEAVFTNTRNTYGGLTVTKTVEGQTDTTVKFLFTVTLDDLTITGTYGEMSFTEGVAQFELGAGESKTAENLPNGLGYTVTEADYSNEGFATVSTGTTGTIVGGSVQTAAFTNTSKTTKVTVKKIWNDADDQDGKRNAVSAKVQLFKTVNGNKSAVGNPVDVGTQNNWTYTWEGLYVFENGYQIYYSVEETLPEGCGYTCTVSPTSLTAVAEDSGTVTVTNTHTPEKTTITIKKVWSDANNQDGKRSGVVATMQLYKTVGQTKTAVGDPVTVGAADDWSKTWTDLPVYEGGVAISYSVTETLKTPNGYAISGNATVTIPNGGEGSITNAYTPEETKATVRKVWNDKDNQDGKRPASLTVNLMNGKTLVQSVTLNEANGWTATVEKLPVYAGGVKITYTWVEDETGLPEGYTLTDTTVNGIITTFTNSYDTEETKATVRKVWDDDNDRDGIRPKKLIVTLMARLKNEATGEITEPEKIKDVELNAGNNWTATVEDLPAKKEGAEIGYYWVENDVPKGYEVTGNSANGTVTTITNTHRITEIGVSVIKVWDDKDNQDRKRPDKLIVTLNADKVSTGKTVELNEANKWTGSIDGLPKYDLNHNEIKYTWSEDTLPEGYTLTKTETDETGYITTLTNSYTPDKISINVEKQWRDDDNRDGLRPQSI
ncbi:MAG: Cna B-type domain-containing protein, partial [Clostridia bacterium]|nr:Cna B-type domain-containing protein [Clostridia bacterium]